jgi:hypothetical protein
MGILQTNQPTQTHKVHIHSNQINWQNTNSQTLDKSGQRQQVVLHLVQGVKVRAHWGQNEAAPTKCTMQDEWYVDRQHFSVVFPVSPS